MSYTKLDPDVKKARAKARAQARAERQEAVQRHIVAMFTRLDAACPGPRAHTREEKLSWLEGQMHFVY
jgi:hypothetical protein